MAGIIKNQILKHLSRFAKNLSSDRIQLSTFKGEGELTDLELDEEVLTELLALPTWMKLTHAYCNRASVRIQWTKLRNTPILLNLDEVTIKVEACEELRQSDNNPTSNVNNYSPGKYGFVSKAIDGITACVNSVEIIFQSQAFESKVQISRIRVESKTPDWKRKELHYTRLKDLDKGEVLIFKELEWQTLRLEARSTNDKDLAPLRLLTNQARARITLKKKLIDGQVVGCRLQVLLDDLLWVFTDSQILAAHHFASSLSGLIRKATEITQRIKAARKLESLPEYQAQLTQSSALRRDSQSAGSKVFDIFDVKETSYHLICEKIDLHFCDDPGAGRSQHPDLKDGGALQLSLSQANFDFYPYHLARGSRRSWLRYTDNPLSSWLVHALTSFRLQLIESLADSMHSPLSRSAPNSTEQPHNPIKTAITDQFGKLMSSCLIIKIHSLNFYKVTTSSKREVPPPFLSSYIDKPPDTPTVHAEFSWFYYPGEINFPLPSPKIFAHLHPIQFHLDTCTILWLNSFVSNLGWEMSKAAGAEIERDYVDIRLELIMPKLVFENKLEYKGQKDRPNSAHFQVARLGVSNYRSADTGTLHQLTQTLETLQRGDLVYGTGFPSEKGDIPLVPEKFILHAEGRDKIRESSQIKCSNLQELAPHLTKQLLWTEPRDVWYIKMEPFWIDFRVEQTPRACSTRNKTNSTPESRPKSILRRSTRPNPSPSILYPFVDSLPVSIWLHISESKKVNTSQNGLDSTQNKRIHALLNGAGNCNVQLTHYEFLFLLRMLEALGELSLFLTLDLERILGPTALQDLVTFLGFLPSIDLSLLFPPQCSDKVEESPSLEMDSIIQESSSGEAYNESSIPGQEANAGSRSCWRVEGKEGNELNPFKSSPFLDNKMDRINYSPIPPPISLQSSPQPLSAISSSMEVLRIGLTSGVKQGLSLTAASFSKVSSGGGLATPDSEVWSNFSSDSGSENNFIHIEKDIGVVGGGGGGGGGEDGPLEPVDDCEVATEVLEEGSPSPHLFQKMGNLIYKEESDNSIGVITVRLDAVEFSQEARGPETTIKFQAKSLFLKECTGISWNDFQTKFGTRNKDWGEHVSSSDPSMLGSPTQRRAIKARLGQSLDLEGFKRATVNLIRHSSSPRINLTDRPDGTTPIRNLITNCTKVFLEASVDLENCEEFIIHMSSLMSLSDIFEDEFPPSPFPLKVDLTGARIQLIEDRPSANITSPGPIPIKVSIPNTLPISRDGGGMFLIGVEVQKKVNEGEELSGLRAELDKVCRQLETTQRRNTELEVEVGTVQDLKIMVHQLQERVVKLQEEKFSLLDYVRSVQGQNHRK